jgi:hypothetical protein
MEPLDVVLAEKRYFALRSDRLTSLDKRYTFDYKNRLWGI